MPGTAGSVDRRVGGQAALLGGLLLLASVAPGAGTSPHPAAASRPAATASSVASPSASPSAVVGAAAGTQGARSAGDPFYPTLGNGGYDVQAYDLALAWSPPATPIDPGVVAGVIVIDAVATQDLSELSLDLTSSNTTVSRVTVDGTPAQAGNDLLGRKLVVVLPEPRLTGATFSIRIAWTARPLAVTKTGEEVPLPAPGDAAGVFRTTARGFIADGAGGFFLAAQPNGAHTLFPANDHPIDKALFTIRLTAPAGMLGTATGIEANLTANADGTITSVFASRHPVATHVVGIVIGRDTVRWATAASGVPIRFVVPTDLAPIADYRLAGVPDVLAWLESVVGPYPFETLGIALTPNGVSAAILEAQTLVLMPATVLDPRISACTWLGAVAHETSHHWFGDLVSLTRWDEKWLSEGHARYYEWRWKTEHDCETRTFEDVMRDAYRVAQQARDAGGPPAAPQGPGFAYDATIYDQGALALFALHERVGEKRFAGIETAWITRYADRSASTADFIALASDVSGMDLGSFLHAWLCGATVPPMPGHPDWSTASADPSPVSMPSSGPPGGAILVGPS